MRAPVSGFASQPKFESRHASRQKFFVRSPSTFLPQRTSYSRARPVTLSCFFCKDGTSMCGKTRMIKPSARRIGSAVCELITFNVIHSKTSRPLEEASSGGLSPPPVCEAPGLVKGAHTGLRHNHIEISIALPFLHARFRLPLRQDALPKLQGYEWDEVENEL